MAKRAPPPPPLPDNGVIDGDDPRAPTKLIKYSLKAIHYRLDEDTGVATCTLNVPASLNPLSECQMWEYYLILLHSARDDDVACLLWTGHGRAFSAGADFSGKAERLSMDPAAIEWFRSTGFSPGAKSGDVALKCLTLAFWDFPKPSVVAVNGLAIGGAANIALANYHDIVVASSAAYFKYPFADLGITPELGSSFMLPRLVGMVRAKHLLLVGDRFTPAAAKEMGLVLEVTEPAELLVRARHHAEALAAKQPEAVALAKRLINGHLRDRIASVLDLENEAFVKVLGNFRAHSNL